jgi:integrase
MRDQGQGHLRSRGQHSWELKFDLGRDPLTGKRLTRHVSFKGTKREAQAELTRLLNRKAEGTYVDPTKMSVAEYLEHWLTVDIDRRVAPKTAQRHRQIVHNNIIPRLGSVPVRKLTAVHIEAFEAELQREGYLKGRKRGQGLTAQTVLHVHRTLSQALEHAVSTEVLFKNPTAQVRPPRPPRREVKILTKSEIATVLRATADTALHLPVLVSVMTGLRRGELFALRWSDVDLTKGRLTVNQSLEQIKRRGEAKRENVFKPPKTATSRRTITIPPLPLAALRQHKSTQASQHLRLGLGKPTLVFTLADGSPTDLDAVTKAFGKVVTETRVTRITFHGLRHTHISHLLMDNIHPKVVSERAGHANVSITLSVYAAYLPTLQADAASGFDAALREELGREVGGKSVAILPLGPNTKDGSD